MCSRDINGLSQIDSKKQFSICINFNSFSKFRDAEGKKVK